MTSRLKLVPFQLLALTAVAAAGTACTRTYDGTIVPTYQTKIVRTGLVPRAVIRRTQVEAPSASSAAQLYPSMPPKPAAEEPVTVASTRRAPRRPAVAKPAQQPEEETTVTCRDETGSSGRVRVVCR